VARPRIVVLLSGGLDSTACVAYYKAQRSRISTLFVDYGQRSRNHELRSASAVAAHYNVALKVLRLSKSNTWNGYVPARNAFLLTVALMHFEEARGLISIGVHAGTSYVDCTPTFSNSMQAVFDLYTSGCIRIDAPFLDWEKRDIYGYLLRRRSPIELTYSCQLGRRQPCGACPSCRDLERLRAKAR
jgi:7-cyano-7-deazaguanine synthase